MSRHRPFDLPLAIQPASMVHASHDVREMDLIGICSDPCCALCGASLHDDPAALKAPCNPSAGIWRNNPPKEYQMGPLDALGADLAPVSRADPQLNAAVINPKELAGAKKPATWSVMPRWVIGLVGRVMSVGAAKYGVFNYRESSISASVYQDALERHLALWFDGEDEDAESGVSHLAHAIACCSLLLDAQATGKLHDDRQKTGLVRKTLDLLEGLLVTLPLPKAFAA
ncbi:dATP/dGTP diphosphohydrolase domain-containing protein [Sphingomonas melonis]|uniref:dATP/dGTP diphosphohydrolase domain-containing protein n=1 Tax=Sphingomonas melonis TaxID=152682 RepID=UPI0035C810EE